VNYTVCVFIPKKDLSQVEQLNSSHLFPPNLTRVCTHAPTHPTIIFMQTAAFVGIFYTSGGSISFQ
jgi:hypothetical protein